MVTTLTQYYEPLLATVKQYKLVWFGHKTQYYTLSKTILHGTLKGGQPWWSPEGKLAYRY